MVRFLAVVLFVAANAFFVAAEFGLIAVRRTRIEELAASGSRRAATVQKALADLNLMLSGCQLGITFSSLGLGAIGEPVLAAIFERWFTFLPRPAGLIATHGAAVALAFTLITFLHVVLGELVPKNLAIALPEATALWVAAPMRAFTYAFRPLIWIFNETANLILTKVLRVMPKHELSSIHTPEEIAIIIEESRRGGTILMGQSRMLTRTLDFPDLKAVEAMVPRVVARSIKSDGRIDDVLDLAEETGYSRFPVWHERPDEFVGVVHLKDMLRESRRNPQASALDVMRDALLVPESLTLDEVLLQMRRKRTHFAIVLDEFGSTSGMLTLEDIIEELVGDIQDESDGPDSQVRKVDGGLRVPGTMRPDELEEATGLRLPEGDYETVAGFILERLGRLARRGDEVLVGKTSIRVANVRKRRIMAVDIRTPD